MSAVLSGSLLVFGLCYAIGAIMFTFEPKTLSDDRRPSMYVGVIGAIALFVAVITFFLKLIVVVFSAEV